MEAAVAGEPGGVSAKRPEGYTGPQSPVAARSLRHSDFHPFILIDHRREQDNRVVKRPDVVIHDHTRLTQAVQHGGEKVVPVAPPVSREELNSHPWVRDRLVLSLSGRVMAQNARLRF